MNQIDKARYSIYEDDTYGTRVFDNQTNKWLTRKESNRIIEEIQVNDKVSNN